MQQWETFCKWETNSLLWLSALLGYQILLELHTMVQLWYFLKSSWRILTRCLQSYLTALFINTSERRYQYEVSRHFSFPFKTGFGSPQKFSWMGSFTMGNSLSSTPACLIHNCTVKKQWGCYSGHCYLYTWLTTHKHFQFSGVKMQLCLIILF